MLSASCMVIRIRIETLTITAVNPKSECRNPKQIRILKIQNDKNAVRLPRSSIRAPNVLFWTFELIILNLFRISRFVIRDSYFVFRILECSLDWIIFSPPSSVLSPPADCIRPPRCRRCAQIGKQGKTHALLHERHRAVDHHKLSSARVIAAEIAACRPIQPIAGQLGNHCDVVGVDAPDCRRDAPTAHPMHLVGTARVPEPGSDQCVSPTWNVWDEPSVTWRIEILLGHMSSMPGPSGLCP